MKRLMSLIGIVLAAGLTSGQDVALITLQSGTTRARVTPSTLGVSLQVKGHDWLGICSGGVEPSHIANLKVDAAKMSWKLPASGLEVAIELREEKLLVNIRSSKPANLIWAQGILPPKAWILPMFEGVYVPVDDAKWMEFLGHYGALNTTADLGLPFWGWDCNGYTLTWIVANPFNNELRFHYSRWGPGRFSHEFTTNNPVKEFGLVIQIGKDSPIEPARIYRAWLKEHGEFVSMKEKIRRTPEAEKLLGASHIYLWGDEILSVDDIRDWKAFAKTLKSQAESDNPSYARELWSDMKADVRKQITEMEKAQVIDRYMKSQVVEELNRKLSDSGKDGTPAELCQRNCRQLADAFPGLFAPLEDWGNGVSPRMVAQLADAGLDRLWLGVDGWNGLVRRPKTVELAKKQGYLIGPYNSYHSVHSPGAKGDNTWETAQFDKTLYETGAIVGADGTKRKGFKQTGFLLSPTAARPYVEMRVSGLMNSFHANSWFMDCDGFGEYFDDYSEAHPATQASDLQARCSRMAWIRDTYGAVIGSEGCSAGVASTIHFAHGVMTPVIGWGDAELKDKSSKYFLGAYYPPTGPAVFFKPVPTKEKYHHIYFDPRFRLPLFETVFHDSVVATHHWSAASGKFSDESSTVELLELLYNVPPLYHLNLDEFAKRKAQIKKHHDFFSPLHRETGLLPLTEFEWLTTDRLVQRTAFGDKIEMVANFTNSEFTFEQTKIPARSILAKHRVTGKILIFTPTESK